MNVFTSDRFTITEVVECERNSDQGLYPRSVFIAFHRCFDIPRPLCVVTLWGTFVEWVEVAEEFRRERIATEVLQAIEARYGQLSMSGATEEGEAFCEFYEKAFR